MVVKGDKKRLKQLLIDAIRLLCKNGLAGEAAFCIEATIGITLSEQDILLITFKEHVCPDGSVISQMLTDADIEVTGCYTSTDKGLPSARDNAQTHCEDQFNGYKPLDNVASNGQHACKEQRNICETAGANLATANIPSCRERPDLHEMSYDYIETNTASCSTDHNNSVASGMAHDEFFSNLSASGDYSLTDNAPQVGSDTAGVHTKSKLEYNDNPLVVKNEESSDLERSWSLDGRYTAEMTPSTLNQLPPDSYKAAHCSKTTFRQPHASYRWKRPPSSSFGSSHFDVKRRALGANVSRTLQTLCKSLMDQASTAIDEPSLSEHVFCQICGARLSSATTLANHIRGTHLSMNVCQCDICGEKFKWTMQLCRHRKRYHSYIDTNALQDSKREVPVLDPYQDHQPVPQPGPPAHL